MRRPGLKNRLPSATHLSLGLSTEGPARLPRGTAMTSLELLPLRAMIRRNGRLTDVPFGSDTRQIDFGRGPVRTTPVPWGDVSTAYRSTGIANVAAYAVVPPLSAALGSASRFLGPLFRVPAVKRGLRRLLLAGPRGQTPEERAQTRTTVWGEVTDNRGGRASARMYGLEPGVTWTVLAALAVLRRALRGEAPPGFQTPAMAYGPGLATECEGVTLEDLEA